jgi:hypothetical protein
MVQNISETGAALDVPDTIGIPEHFILKVIEQAESVRCRSVWRTERQIGVAFETAG